MKKFLSLLLVFLLVLALASCGKKAAAPLEPQTLLDELLASNVFSVSLTELPESKAGVFYTLDTAKLSSARMYHASGTCEEQAAVFTAADETAAKEIAGVLKALVADWAEQDASYTPAEVAKLESAVLRQSGVHVILVIAADSAAAAKLVDKYL